MATQSNETFLPMLFRQAPGFLAYLRGRDFTFELANDAYLQLAGHRDLIGKRAEDALPELGEQSFLELLETVYETRQPYAGLKMRIRLHDHPGEPPREALVDFTFQPITDESGEPVGILCQGHDATAHLRKMRTEREWESRYRDLFESIDDGFCILRMVFEGDRPVDYAFEEANAAFEAHTGLVDAVGKTAREMVPDLDVSWFELYGGVATTGEPVRFENEAPAMGRWFEVYATRVGGEGSLLVALVFKDITRRKEAELDRERLLEAEKRARTDAEAANRLKDEFLAAVSHDLRTPLSAILGWTQLLQQSPPGTGNFARGLDVIERNAQAQLQLIEDLLDVGRIASGQHRLERKPVRVAKVVEHAVESVRLAAEAKDVVLDIALDPNSVVVGDAGRLQQITWNLVSNAVKFTPCGGRVEITTSCKQHKAIITVRDTGDGIAPEFLPYVFERFSQEKAGMARRDGGLGLGLSIVKSLAEAHGGVVTAESDGAGKGSTFLVELPAFVGTAKGEP